MLYYKMLVLLHRLLNFLFSCLCHHHRAALNHIILRAHRNITVVCLVDFVQDIGSRHLMKTFWAAVLLICVPQQ